MNGFIIDNSVVMAWCFEDQASEYSDAILERLKTEKAFVPSIWTLEVVNVLIVAERKKILNRSSSMRFITLLNQLPVTVEYEKNLTHMKDLLNLGRDLTLSSYDAAYLDLAMKRGMPLATLDIKLKKAAQASHVELIQI